MKIAMLIDRLAVGGGPEYIRLVAGHLPEHRFTVLSLDGGTLPALRALDNVEIARWPGRAALKSAHFDLIHCHHLRSLLRLFPPCGIPVVNTIHGIHCRKFEFDGPAGAIKKTLRTKLEHFLLSRVDVNIALTADDAEWLERSYHLRNLAIIPNGVELPSERSFADRDAVRKALGLPRRRYWLLMIGRFAVQKGHDILLKAVAAARDFLERHQVGIALIGDGDTCGAARDFADRHGLNDIVFFCGRRLDAQKYLPLADLLLLPSRWEGLPLVALEAGIRGIPVLGSAAPGISSILEDGKTGWLFETGDFRGLAALLSAPECYENARIVGLNWKSAVEKSYLIETMAARLNDLYCRAAGGGHHGR